MIKFVIAFDKKENMPDPLQQVVTAIVRAGAVNPTPTLNTTIEFGLELGEKSAEFGDTLYQKMDAITKELHAVAYVKLYQYNVPLGEGKLYNPLISGDGYIGKAFNEALQNAKAGLNKT